jgi:hypothetical protein
VVAPGLAGAARGSVALVRGEDQPDFSDLKVTFVARISAQVGLGWCVALLLRPDAT